MLKRLIDLILVSLEFLYTATIVDLIRARLFQAWARHFSNRKARLEGETFLLASFG